jgi:hypothetical protein
VILWESPLIREIRLSTKEPTSACPGLPVPTSTQLHRVGNVTGDTPNLRSAGKRVGDLLIALWAGRIYSDYLLLGVALGAPLGLYSWGGLRDGRRRRLR